MDVEFQVGDETLALLGSSGCGKSMTLRCIAGIETPDEGRIVLNNRVLFDKEKNINLLPRDRKVGILFQNYALFPNMTLKENIAIGIPKTRKDKIENEKAVDEKIKAFSLEGLENNYPHQLSGGQQQRVAIARMLLNEPEILMFDEPFSALDSHLRWIMEKELLLILEKHKGPAIYVSHNRDEVYRVCDTIAVLKDGKVEEFNTKENLFSSPQTLNTAILTGCKNTSKVERRGDRKIFSKDWNLELTSLEPVDPSIEYVGIRAHDLKISKDTSLPNTFEVNIIDRIKNMFSYAIIVSNNKEETKEASSQIYIYISEEEFNSLKDKSRALISLPPDKLLLLKKEDKYRLKD